MLHPPESLFVSRKPSCSKKCAAKHKSVMFSPWNSLEVKNLNYKTQAYQTIIKYYRENSCKAIKH